MKRERLTYLVLIWLLMTLGYLAALSFYFDFSLRETWPDVLVFSLFIFGAGLSLWYAIQYMDVGVRNVSEIIITHILAASLVAYVMSFVTRWFVFSKMDWVSSEYAEPLSIAKTFVGYITYALLLLNFYIFKYRENIKKREVAEEELKSLLQEAELNLLKSQLNPHFIFNSLNSISALTLTSPEKARNMIVKLSSFLRYSLSKGKEELVSLEEEISNARLFLDIEKTRFGDRLKVVEDFSDACMKVKVPVMILQPMIENAVKFSAYDTIGEVMIYLSCQTRGEGVLISIKNPFDPAERGSKGKGIGLQNVKQRLQLLFGRNSELVTETTKEEFIVRIFIPVI